jgi:hypothetical protein
MKFIDNTYHALTKGIVAWIIYLSTIANLVYQYTYGINLPSWVNYAILGLILLGRILKQESVSGKSEDEEEGLADG